MKKLILIIVILFICLISKAQFNDTIRGIEINHKFILNDSAGTVIQKLFEKVEYSINTKQKIISCKVKFYANRSNAEKDTLQLIMGSGIIIDDILYKLNYSGTTYTYDNLPNDIYSDAINHCVAEILWLNLHITNGIKSKDIVKY